MSSATHPEGATPLAWGKKLLRCEFGEITGRWWLRQWGCAWPWFTFTNTNGSPSGDTWEITIGRRPKRLFVARISLQRAGWKFGRLR